MSKSIVVQEIEFEAPGLVQKLLIQKRVLDHIHDHRQLTPISPERGGQLFGVVTLNQIIIQGITGPYSDDHSNRFSYRSCLRSAQAEINMQHQLGRIYLGEWHTHPEVFPRPSQSDLSTILKIQSSSKLNLNGIFMLIAGNQCNPVADFLAFQSDGDLHVFHYKEK